MKKWVIRQIAKSNSWRSKMSITRLYVSYEGILGLLIDKIIKCDLSKKSSKSSYAILKIKVCYAIHICELIWG